MVRITRYAVASLDRVWDVVSDPTTYPDWLYGAKQIRDVDDDWPQPGSRFYHRVGLIGPLTIPDHSEVKAVDPPKHLELEVLARPFMRGRVTFHLEEVRGTDGIVRTSITMDEQLVGHAAPLAPLLEPSLEVRNQASLNALVARLNEPT